MATKPIRIVIVDDHDLSRAGARAILTTEPGFTIVGEAGNGRDGLARCLQLKPDVVMLDVHMADLNGMALLHALRHEYPPTRVVVMTVDHNLDYVSEAFAAGAAGYVLKEASRDELVRAVWRAVRGEPFISADLAVGLLQRLGEASSQRPAAGVARLTPREHEVLHLLAQGLTNRAIGQELGISAGTAKTYVERVLTKLGVGDRTQAAVRAMQLGLLSQ